MKPVSSRLVDYTTAKPVETSPMQVYDRVLWMLGEEQALVEDAILSSQISPRKRERLVVERNRLVDVITLVEGMKARHLGVPVATAAPKRPPASLSGSDAGYGEP